MGDGFEKTGNFHFIKKVFLVLWVLAFLCLPSPSRSEIIDRIVAQVNEDIITLYELNQSLGPYIQKIKEGGFSEDQEQTMLQKARENVLQEMVNDKLADQEVIKSGITVAEGEVDDALKRVGEMNRMTPEQLKAALAQEGLTFDDYRNNLKKQLLRTKLVNREVRSKIVVTEKDIQSYYEKHGGQSEGEPKYHLRSIIKRVPDISNEEQRKAAFKEMESIAAKLHAGEPFYGVAQQHSDLLASEGGDLGMFALDELSPIVRQAVAGLKEGEYTSIIDTDQGYQIFYLQEIRKTSGKSIEETSDEIKEILYNERADQKFQTWVRGLKDRSYIKIIQ